MPLKSKPMEDYRSTLSDMVAERLQAVYNEPYYDLHASTVNMTDEEFMRHEGSKKAFLKRSNVPSYTEIRQDALPTTNREYSPDRVILSLQPEMCVLSLSQSRKDKGPASTAHEADNVRASFGLGKVLRIKEHAEGTRPNRYWGSYPPSKLRGVSSASTTGSASQPYYALNKRLGVYG